MTYIKHYLLVICILPAILSAQWQTTLISSMVDSTRNNIESIAVCNCTKTISNENEMGAEKDSECRKTFTEYVSSGIILKKEYYDRESKLRTIEKHNYENNIIQSLSLIHI